MRVSLVVLSPGATEGKSIPVRTPEFVIGRDPQCHLRPASPVISKRHCAVVVRGRHVFLQDFGSTNGTLLNGEPVHGEAALGDGDRIKVGPLEFAVRVQASLPVDRPTPAPPTKGAAVPSPDDAAATLLLETDDAPPAGSPGVDAAGVPTGSTVFEIPAAAAAPATGATAPTPAGPPPAPKPPVGTSEAAGKILDKYLRRPRR